MTNLFLKVNKDFFNLGLNPTEILVLAQIMEFDTNTGDCFMSDKALADLFGVSDKTISRTLKTLEDRGFIKRDTKSVKGGKERHIKLNAEMIEKELTKDKMTLDSVQQQTKCPLSKDKLSGVNRQNDLIKDNIKQIREEDNYSVEFHPADENTTAQNAQKVEKYPEISPELLLSMGARYEITEDNLIRIIDTGKLFKIKQG